MRHILLLVGANLLFPVAIITFAIGFFPYKPFLPGLATFDDFDLGTPPVAPFNKVILMVVDALRRYSFFLLNQWTMLMHIVTLSIRTLQAFISSMGESILL